MPCSSLHGDGSPTVCRAPWEVHGTNLCQPPQKPSETRKMIVMIIMELPVCQRLPALTCCSPGTWDKSLHICAWVSASVKIGLHNNLTSWVPVSSAQLTKGETEAQGCCLDLVDGHTARGWRSWGLYPGSQAPEQMSGMQMLAIFQGSGLLQGCAPGQKISGRMETHSPGWRGRGSGATTSSPGLLPATGSSVGRWVHGLAAPSGDQGQITSSVGTTFSWKQTPARIPHTGPFNMGPQWPRGQSLQPQSDKRIRKEAQRTFLTLEKQMTHQSTATRRSLTCWGWSQPAPHPRAVALNQPGFLQGQSQGRQPQSPRWMRQFTDLLSFVPTIAQGDRNDKLC